MTRLKKSQKEFLEHHGISTDEVFDANGNPPRVYMPMMKEAQCRVAIGVTPCKPEGHTLRDARGRCVQCFPATLGFHSRYRKAGKVYIAHSERHNLIKVGITEGVDLETLYGRIALLNKDSYGGASDWILLEYCEAEEAGLVETHIHRRLNEWSLPATYWHGGRLSDCRELFSCEPKQAFAVFREVIDRHLSGTL